MKNHINIFSATCTRELAQRVVNKINENIRENEKYPNDTELVELGNCKIEYFKDREVTCDFQSSIRRKPVYIFGNTGTDNVVELLIMLDAAKRAAPSEIHIILPYYGYGRQDKKEGKNKRGPIGAKLMADMLSVAAGHKLEGIIVIDLHADAIEGFFDVPVNHISGMTIFKHKIQNMIKDNPSNYIIASPDAGGKQRATRIAKKMGLELVGMDKTRVKPGEVADISMAGEVEGKKILLIDDMVASAGTLIKAADYLIEQKKADSVFAFCTHPVLVDGAVEKINNAKNLTGIIVSDSNHLNEESLNCSKIEVVSTADILAKIIGNVLTVGSSLNEINS